MTARPASPDSSEPSTVPPAGPGDGEQHARRPASDLDLTTEGPPAPGPRPQLDLTQEPPPKRIPPPLVLGGRIALQREVMRGILAMSLLVLLAFVMLGTFVMAWRSSDAAVPEKLLERMLSPLVVLVSAATGFYFGSEARDSSDEGRR